MTKQQMIEKLIATGNHTEGSAIAAIKYLYSADGNPEIKQQIIQAIYNS